jgi:SEC-C motif domain protein
VKVGPNRPCPCGRGSKYKRCCLPLHQGAPAVDPESLMRSRYAAYAAGVAEYILATTHPEGPEHRADRARWTNSVQDFTRSTRFEGLEVMAAGEDGDVGWVEFRARLTRAGQDVSLSERSTFLRVDGRWLYHSGKRSGQ